MLQNEQMIPSELLEIKNYVDPGFKPIVDYKTWRVAILNYIEELNPENISKMEKHTDTDEVFVLLRGEFILFIGEKLNEVNRRIYGIKLEPFKIYNVKRDVWHTHTISKDGSVLIVENQNTTYENSISMELADSDRREIVHIASTLFSP